MNQGNISSISTLQQQTCSSRVYMSTNNLKHSAKNNPGFDSFLITADAAQFPYDTPDTDTQKRRLYCPKMYVLVVPPTPNIVLTSVSNKWVDQPIPSCMLALLHL